MSSDHYVVTVDVKRVTFRTTGLGAVARGSGAKEIERHVDDTMHVVVRRETMEEIKEAVVAIMKVSE